MTYKELCENFFFNKDARTIRFAAGQHMIRMMKAPIVEGLDAVYHSVTFFAADTESHAIDRYRERQMELVTFIAHDSVLVTHPVLRGVLEDHIEGWPTTAAENVELLHIKAVLEEAKRLISDEEIKSADVKPYMGDERATALFFGEKSGDLDMTAIFEPHCLPDDAFVDYALVLPDYKKAAEIWLKARWYRAEYGEKETVRNWLAMQMAANRKAEKIAAGWEADQTCGMYRLREIQRAVKDMATVTVSMDGLNGVVTTRIPTDAFRYAHRPGVNLWRIQSVATWKESERVMDEMGNSEPPISCVREIRYRGKVIYTRDKEA